MITNTFLLGVLLFLVSDTLILRLNPCLNSGESVPSVLKRHFWRILKMEQDLPSCHLVDVISQIACIISSAYKDGLQLIHFMLIWNIFMETLVVKYIRIKLVSVLATPSLMQKRAVLENHLMTSSMTLVFLNMSPLMASNTKLGKIRSSTRICVYIGFITISLHRANPMKILMKVP